MNNFPTRMSPPAAPQPTASPCVGICRLDANGLCVGCDRNLTEIAGWSQYDAATRRRIMDEVLPQRRNQR